MKTSPETGRSAGGILPFQPLFLRKKKNNKSKKTVEKLGGSEDGDGGG